MPGLADRPSIAAPLLLSTLACVLALFLSPGTHEGALVRLEEHEQRRASKDVSCTATVSTSSSAAMRPQIIAKCTEIAPDDSGGAPITQEAMEHRKEEGGSCAQQGGRQHPMAMDDLQHLSLESLRSEVYWNSAVVAAAACLYVFPNGMKNFIRRLIFGDQGGKTGGTSFQTPVKPCHRWHLGCRASAPGFAAHQECADS